MIPLDIATIPDCTCETCISYCRRPGWFTPEEAQMAIASGYGKLLMLDYWVSSGDKEDIFLLCPANPGYERQSAPEVSLLTMALYAAVGTSNPLYSGCTMLSTDNRCGIHAIKPLECKVAHHAFPDASTGLHEEIAMLWDNDAAQLIVNQWRKHYAF
jgi:Fe-S-cluster containining protein